MSRRRRPISTCSASLLAMTASGTWAQDDPNKPVRLVVPFAPAFKQVVQLQKLTLA